MQNQTTIPAIVGRNVAVAGREVAANISCEADEAARIEPGIGQIVTIKAGRRQFTGEVIDRWKARDEQTGALSVEVVVKCAVRQMQLGREDIAAIEQADELGEIIDRIVKQADVRARSRCGKISEAFERRCTATIAHLRQQAVDLLGGQQ